MPHQSALPLLAECLQPDVPKAAALQVGHVLAERPEGCTAGTVQRADYTITGA